MRSCLFTLPSLYTIAPTLFSTANNIAVSSANRKFALDKLGIVAKNAREMTRKNILHLLFVKHVYLRFAVLLIMVTV